MKGLSRVGDWGMCDFIIRGFWICVAMCEYIVSI